MKMPTMAAAIAFACVVSAGAASAQTALKDVSYVREGIVNVGMAYEISERCGDLRARL